MDTASIRSFVNDVGPIVGFVGVVVGVLGGGIAVGRSLGDWLAARSKRLDDAAYEAWVKDITAALHSRAGNTCRVEEAEHRHAARAVSEGRLAWAPMSGHVWLPKG